MSNGFLQLRLQRFFTQIRRLKVDIYLIIPLIIIIIISALAQFSVENGTFFKKHIINIIIGCIAFFIVYKIPINIIKKISWIAYPVAFVLLMLVEIKGFGVVSRGGQRWLRFGGYSVQPSELMKLGLILALGTWYNFKPPKSILNIILSGVLMVSLPFLLVFLQPDLGTSLVLLAIFVGMTYWAGAELGQMLVFLGPAMAMIFGAIALNSEYSIHLGKITFLNREFEIASSFFGIMVLILVCILIFLYYKPWQHRFRIILLGLYSFVVTGLLFCVRPFLWACLKEYQRKRLAIFLDPYSDPKGNGYNIIQSILSIGNGGLFGQGFKTGQMTQGSFVPEQRTDFIFSCISEEFGFIGCLILIICFLIICFRLFRLASSINDIYFRTVIAGISVFLIFHVIVNMSMNLALMPVTGIPLPMVSFGGTSMIVFLFSLGLSQAIFSQKDNIRNF